LHERLACHGSPLHDHRLPSATSIARSSLLCSLRSG
jgi:hypothetical protein